MIADTSSHNSLPSKETDADIEEKLLEPEVSYKVYRYRYLVAALFAGVSIANQMIYVTTAPLTTQIINIYDLDVFTVNLTSLVFLFMYVPANFPSNWLLDEWGTRYGITLGASLTLICAWIRIGASESYNFVIFGQLVGAIAQPLILNAPQKISAVWFPPESRSLATTLMSVSAPLGVAIGFMLPGFLIPLNLTKENGKEVIGSLMMLEAIIASVIIVPALIFFRGKPKSPPSASSGIQKAHYIASLKKILTDRNYLLLAAAAGIVISTSNTIAAVSQQLLNPFEFSQHEITIFGAVMIPSGLVGSIFFMLQLKRTRAYKKILCITTISGTLFFICTMGAICSRNFWFVLSSIGLLGFTAAPVLPIALEFACELTFPAGEASAGGFILSMGNLVSGLEVVLMDLVLAKKQDWEGSAWSGLLMIVLLLIAVTCSLLVKEQLARTQHDELYTLVVDGVPSSRGYQTFLKKAASRSFERPCTKFLTVSSFRSNP